MKKILAILLFIPLCGIAQTDKEKAISMYSHYWVSNHSDDTTHISVPQVTKGFRSADTIYAFFEEIELFDMLSERKTVVLCSKPMLHSETILCPNFYTFFEEVNQRNLIEDSCWFKAQVEQLVIGKYEVFLNIDSWHISRLGNSIISVADKKVFTDFMVSGISTRATALAERYSKKKDEQVAFIDGAKYIQNEMSEKIKHDVYFIRMATPYTYVYWKDKIRYTILVLEINGKRLNLFYERKNGELECKLVCDYNGAPFLLTLEALQQKYAQDNNQ